MPFLLYSTVMIGNYFNKSVMQLKILILVIFSASPKKILQIPLGYLYCVCSGEKKVFCKARQPSSPERQINPPPAYAALVQTSSHLNKGVLFIQV